MNLKSETSRDVRPRRSWIGLVLGAFLVISVAVNLFLAWRSVQLTRALDRTKTEAQLEIGAAVPPIQARGMDGRIAYISYQKSDVPTVLYFFSPGCDTCERNVDNIKKLADQKRGEYKIIGLSLTEGDLEGYTRDHGLNFPVYAGLGVETTLAYKLGRVPQTTVVSADGRVLANWHGAFEGRLLPTVTSFFQGGF